MTTAKIEQVRGVLRKRHPLQYLVENQRRVAGLSFVVDCPVFGTKGAMKVLNRSFSDIVFKPHEAQIQVSMQDGRSDRVRSSAPQPAPRASVESISVLLPS